MNNSVTQQLETLTRVQDFLPRFADDPSISRSIQAELTDFEQIAVEEGAEGLVHGVRLLSRLSEVAGSLHELGEEAIADDVKDSLSQGISSLAAVIQSPDKGTDYLSWAEEAQDRWSDQLALVDSSADTPFDDPWSTTEESLDNEENDDLIQDDSDGSSGQIDLILQSLLAGDSQTCDSESVASSLSSPSESVTTSHPGAPPHNTSSDKPEDPSDTAEIEAPKPISLKLDDETKDAFFDDATRCLAMIEQSILEYEDNTNESAPLIQICRELHTLKGASGSIGLTALADHLHRLEDHIDEHAKAKRPVSVDRLLQAVDTIRSQLGMLSSEKNEPATASTQSDIGASEGTQDSVRVKAAHLDRLLDMLAELVMLRNRRDSHVDKLKAISNEIFKCVSRMRSYEARFPIDGRQNPNDAPGSVSSLTEIANDMLELGREIGDTYEPLVEDNLVMSRFIQQFRGEMMELRRKPISGLFQRLRRVARDAAKAESKQVAVTFSGEQIGLESSLTDKLYEPLMHIVRNAVSHGIESPPQRHSARKSEEGELKIGARAGANLVVIEVQDDGKGLDYDALRRKGIERGLIPIDRPASRDELAQLIFDPGFSTNDQVSEISGRGVGMDVVASTVEKMHGWVEIESNPGEGTCIRLMVPRCSFIEHAMVFQSCGQFFAIPTQFIASSRSLADVRGDEQDHTDAPTELSTLLKLDNVANHTKKEIIKIQSTSANLKDRSVDIIVDRIVGLEEVVIRPLPSLMKSQRIYSGITLAGNGAVMLILDADMLVHQASRQPAPSGIPTEASVPMSGTKPRLLVVDDSLSARRVLVKRLKNAGAFEIDQASDGVEALSFLRSQAFDAVFTDLDMPRMSGFELIREIKSRSEPGDRSFPITVVSSRNDNASRQEATENGASAYLLKPATEADVKDTLKRLGIVGRPSV